MIATISVSLTDQIVDGYEYACRIVQSKLPSSLRSRFSGADFVGDAILVILADPMRFSLVKSIISTIIVIARRRIVDEVRSPRTRPVIDLTELEPYIPDCGQPVASAYVECNEAYESMIGGLDPESRNVIDFKRHGYSCPEIAIKTGWHVRKVQRLISKLECRF